MKRKMFLRKLLLFMAVFALMFATEIVTQQHIIYAYNDYIWAVTRGGATKELPLKWDV